MEVKERVLLMTKELRSAGMTQKRIAGELGCSQAAVSRWYSGVNIPEGELLMKLIALHARKCPMAEPQPIEPQSSEAQQ